MNADLLPDEPSELEAPPDEPEEATDLDYVDKPCTDESDDDDARWEVFIPDEDESDPQPDPGDLRIENSRKDQETRRLGDKETWRQGDLETRRKLSLTPVSLSPPLHVSLSSPEVRTMLAKSIVETINRLLKEGKLSQRKIAEQLGVSRSTVCSIARGQRALFGHEPTPDGLDTDTHEPAQRCPKCGFLVHMPCLVCRTREYREQQKCLGQLAAERPASPRRPRRRRRRRSRSSPARPRRHVDRARVA